ncbi:peptide ABC transporter permease [Gordoniibacillus kamchatkensis]|uniref:Peptide ABC transporter permease n=1 Tax=Gordoniibacillus kamchatkensis TaxID=1590651 RepID=A0ABR5AA61_9BACL|nr:ABC transporter permease [Paenibacillus sp. VKM B-2647]KIL37936.1 peptide ABC transporter permease [Paenibacillus sp. VKM B-2647]
MAKAKTNSRKKTLFLNFMQRFGHNRLAVAGLFALILIALIVTIIPPFLPFSQEQIDPLAFGASPDGKHLLGTDDVGRDVLSRLLYGGRISLFVGIVSTMLSVAIGIPLGLMAAYFRGKFETVTMRLADIFLSFPNIILILFLVSIFGPSIFTVTVVIGVLGWPFFARLMFGTVLSIREKDYIEGAVAIGEKQRTILLKYILPNAIAPILIQITFRIASAIIIESSLSFLGLGVQPPAASWGNMLYNAQSITILSKKIWIWLPPGLFLVLTILSMNFVGNGLRDALDPKTKIRT